MQGPRHRPIGYSVVTIALAVKNGIVAATELDEVIAPPAVDDIVGGRVVYGVVVAVSLVQAGVFDLRAAPLCAVGKTHNINAILSIQLEEPFDNHGTSRRSDLDDEVVTDALEIHIRGVEVGQHQTIGVGRSPAVILDPEIAIMLGVDVDVA